MRMLTEMGIYITQTRLSGSVPPTCMMAATLIETTSVNSVPFSLDERHFTRPHADKSIQLNNINHLSFEDRHVRLQAC